MKGNKQDFNQKNNTSLAGMVVKRLILSWGFTPTFLPGKNAFPEENFLQVRFLEV